MSYENDTNRRVKESLFRLINYVEGYNYSGYDPYDGLNAKRLEAIFGSKISRIFFTQLFKLSPIDIRRLVGVDASRNSKGIGLFCRHI